MRDQLFNTDRTSNPERFFARDTNPYDSPLFKEQDLEGEPRVGAPGAGGDTDGVDLGYGANDIHGTTTFDPMFGPQRFQDDSRTLFQSTFMGRK